MTEFQIPSFYYLMHRDIEKNYGNYKFMTFSDISNIIAQYRHIPKDVAKIIAAEMINFKLITKIDTYKFQISKLRINPIDNKSKMFHKVGLW